MAALNCQWPQRSREVSSSVAVHVSMMAHMRLVLRSRCLGNPRARCRFANARALTSGKLTTLCPTPRQPYSVGTASSRFRLPSPRRNPNWSELAPTQARRRAARRSAQSKSWSTKREGPRSYRGPSMLLPRWVSTENYRAAGIVVLEVPTNFGGSKSMTRTGLSTKPMATRASEWRRLLESGEVSTRADIARRFGVSQARVTQALRARGRH